MGYTNFHKGFLFSEGKIEVLKVCGNIKSDLSFKIGAQLKNLSDVKDALVNKAKWLGANAIINFTYGQKSRWLAIDDVAFFGSGTAVVIADSVIEKFKNTDSTK